MEFEKFILRNKLWFIIIPIILTIASVIFMIRIKINSNLESYFPDDLPSKVSSSIVEEHFGNGEPLLLIFESDDILNPESLTRIKNITSDLKMKDYFDDVISLFDMKDIKGEDGTMIVDPLISDIPRDKNEIETLRNNIINNELAFKNFVSEDFRYSLVLINVNSSADEDSALSAVQEIIDDYPGIEKTYINGMPYMRVEINNKITRDLMILLPLALLIMIAFFYLSFKEFRGVWLPLSVVIISTAVSMAILPLMNWELTLIGVIIPIMMIAIANNYGVHLIVRYQEFNAAHPGWNIQQIVLKSVNVLKKPILLTGLTTIVGIFGLVLHILIPAQQIGIIGAIGIGLALVLSLTFVPALLAGLKKGKIHNEFLKEKNGVLGKILEKIAVFITKSPRTIIAIFTFILLIFGLLINFLKIAPDNDKVLPKNHPYNQSISIANEHFGGTKFLSVMFEGNIQDPELLKRIDNYEGEIKKIEGTGSVSSITTVIKMISKALNDKGTEGYNTIPETQDAVAQYLLLYSMNGAPEDLEQFVNFDYTRALMNIQFHATSMKQLNNVIDKVNNLVKDDPAFSVVSGFSLTDKEMAESTFTGQIYSLIFALIAIFILIMWIFKSPKAGLLGSIPLVFAVICTFGIMGILKIELNIVTALLSSISIGVGVDYTIHMFWRLKLEFENRQSYPAAIKQALKVTGRGIVINALSVMLGFSVLLFSSFPYLKMFSALIILSLSLCLICALILIPAICIVIKPSFLNNKIKIRKI